MGGAIFSKGKGPLYTPRMPPQVYEYVRNKCHARLRELFVAVATPLEGPAKPDFGDVDISLAWPRAELFPTRDALSAKARFADGGWLKAAAAAVGAFRTQGVIGSSSQIHAAVEWPEEYSHLIPPVSVTEEECLTPAISTEQILPSKQTKAFIQVDLHIFTDMQTLQWQLFKHAHGDFWSILGSTIRPYGLTADEVGLYLRIPEIEKQDHKRAKVLLTSEPAEVLAFLGMRSGSSSSSSSEHETRARRGGQDDADVDIWAARFAEKKDFFEYVASTRLFRSRVPPKEDTPLSEGEGASRDSATQDLGRDDEQFHKAGSGTSEPATTMESSGVPALPRVTAESTKTSATEMKPSELGEDNTTSVRSGERRRMKQRPLFAEFINGYLPDRYSHHHHHHHPLLPCEDASTDGPASDQQDIPERVPSPLHTRESVREEAFSRFGPLVRYTYEKRLREWTIERQRIKIKKDVKAIVPLPYTIPGPGAPSKPTEEDPRRDAEACEAFLKQRLDPSFRGQIVSALVKIILDQDYSLGIVPGDVLKGQADGVFDEDKVRNFVATSWRDVARVLNGNNAVAAEQRKLGKAG
ncbi:hypothetical protein MN608_03976 [Microdochium nivale]|nr:hypothetical protein MN608_03976 [Microdochium nivale]